MSIGKSKRYEFSTSLSSWAWRDEQSLNQCSSSKMRIREEGNTVWSQNWYWKRTKTKEMASDYRLQGNSQLWFTEWCGPFNPATPGSIPIPRTRILGQELLASNFIVAKTSISGGAGLGGGKTLLFQVTENNQALFFWEQTSVDPVGRVLIILRNGSFPWGKSICSLWYQTPCS